MLTAHRKSPNRARELRERVWAIVEEKLGGGKVICGRCRATLATFSDCCTAELDDPCPGFEAIDVVTCAAERHVGLT